MEMLRQSVLRARSVPLSARLEPPNKSVESQTPEIVLLKQQLADVQSKLGMVMHMLQLDEATINQAPTYVRVIDIKKLVCAYFDVTEHDLDAQIRTAGIVRARQIAMYLARQHTVQSMPVIGKLFGHRDHTTVLHAIKKIGNAVCYNETIQIAVAELDRQIMELKRQRAIG